MLSYQHGYHAGNLADVHKHALLAWMLDYLTRKDKPLCFIETHAGRGLYRLDAAEALKTGEAARGIGLVEEMGWFPADHPYARVLGRVRAAHGPAAYPGSPMVAALSLRPGDRMHLAELHPQEIAALREAMAPHGAECRQEDGLAMAGALCPPEPRRGVMLVDPAYEVKTDYDVLPGFVRRIHRRWPVGILVLWYPVLLSGAHEAMLARLAELLPQGVAHEVGFAPAREGHRMVGSGLFVVNPPYGLDEEARGLTLKFEALGAA